MKKIVFLLMILILFASHAFGVVEADKFKLAGVKFVGITNVSEKELSKTLAAKPFPRWKFWVPEPTFTFGDLEDDLLRIKQFYQAHGYYHTEVTFKTKKIKVRPIPLIHVTYTITEGPPVIIKAIVLKIRQEIDGVSEQDLLEPIPLKIGQIFEIANYREAKKVILKILGNKGHPLAELKGRVMINVDDNQADVTFDLNPGLGCIFGPVSILQDDTYVKDVVIYRAISFKQGETYSTDKVDESRRNLFDLDIFKLALIKPGKPAKDQNAVPMIVQVKPKKRQSIKIGVGYGSEDGFRVKGAWTYRNVWGWAGKLSVSAKRSDLIENSQIEYIQPYFLDEKNALLSTAGFQREKFESHTNRKVFANASFNRKFKKNWTWTAGYNLEVNRIEDLYITDPEEIERIAADSNYMISSMDSEVVRDTTDSDLYPTKGSLVSVSIELASNIFGSEIDFFKPALELVRYQPITDNILLAGRIGFQTIQEVEDTEDIPIFKRLFLGGSNTVRGYGYQKLGPMDENGKPLGGLTSVNANLELRYPIYNKISGVVFLDMGLLDEESFRQDLSDMRYGCGAGIRYNTIIGPVRVDLGYKLNPPREEIEDRWMIHFSIGQAF